MSATLLVLLPLGLVAIVSSLCFVGCNFHPVLASFFKYQDAVLGTSGVMALWPLDETSGTTASNAVSGAPPGTDGTYLATAVPYPDDTQDPLRSAPAPGTFPQLDQKPGIVAGDCAGGDPNQPNPCTGFDGGYVSVSFDPTINPPQFSIEAWVRPDWTETDPPAFRVVMMSRDNSPPTFKGFALYARPENVWAVSTSDGATPLSEVRANGQLALGLTNHLVATYDGGTLTLYVDADASLKPNVAYLPNATAPLYIGTGAPELPLRSSTVANDPTHGPLNPFKGAIQDVAIYNRALTSTEVAKHFANGNAFAI
ncbi:MAG: LamG domain-containing protein [Methylobacteriaceae bacterium]|nr:LamG domain-containing protein [Methylobacteriaceae bacterium]MBV9634681.1 LamG domain-containing protein [Methylobacteriaceae bacterium]